MTTATTHNHSTDNSSNTNRTAAPARGRKTRGAGLKARVGIAAVAAVALCGGSALTMASPAAASALNQSPTFRCSTGGGHAWLTAYPPSLLQDGRNTSWNFTVFQWSGGQWNPVYESATATMYDGTAGYSEDMSYLVDDSPTVVNVAPHSYYYVLYMSASTGDRSVQYNLAAVADSSGQPYALDICYT
jgi:hypothetical protein